MYIDKLLHFRQTFYKHIFIITNLFNEEIATLHKKSYFIFKRLIFRFLCHSISNFNTSSDLVNNINWLLTYLVYYIPVYFIFCWNSRNVLYFSQCLLFQKRKNMMPNHMTQKQ